MVAVGRDPDTFTAAIRSAVGERSPAKMARRIEVARRNGWDERIGATLTLLDEGLSARLRDARPRTANGRVGAGDAR